MRLTEQDKLNLEKVKQLIECDHKVHHTIEHFAEAALMSRSKLIKAYKHYFGMAIFEHLRYFRMALGKHLLDENKLPIKAIAFKCGYSYPGNFTTAFKKKYGISPTEYRNL